MLPTAPTLVVFKFDDPPENSVSYLFFSTKSLCTLTTEDVSIICNFKNFINTEP